MPASKKLNRFAVAACGLALLSGSLAQPVLAASLCADANDLAAFRTAAVQQQLMVAALTCHDVDAYNRFVLAYQPELQKSDADLKAYFIKKGHEAEYDTFKTKLANLSSLSDLANGSAYCSNAAAAFDMAMSSHHSLASFVADQRLMIAVPEAASCSEAKSAAPILQTQVLQTASVQPVAKAKPATKVRIASALPPSANLQQNTSVTGVPVYDLPASPYGNPSPYRGQGVEQADDAIAAPPAPGYYDATEIPPPPPPRAQLQQAARQQDQQDYRGYYASQYAYPRPNRYRWAPPPPPPDDSYYYYNQR